MIDSIDRREKQKRQQPEMVDRHTECEREKEMNEKTDVDRKTLWFWHRDGDIITNAKIRGCGSMYLRRIILCISNQIYSLFL